MSKKDTKKITEPGTKGIVKIPYPNLILLLVALVIYTPSINSGFTELDDKIFIVDQEQFIKDPSNIAASYSRGTFSEKNDNYYRPLLLNSFIINYQLSGKNIKGYHIFNILLHLASVALIYWLFTLLFNDKLKAFLLSLIFAVHPVLTQAVAWIPGRNDSLLFIFAVLFLISAIKYARNGKPIFLLYQFLALLLALFTKETALLVAPATMAVLLASVNFKWLSKTAFLQYGSWALSGIVWFVIRSNASLRSETFNVAEFPSNFIERFPLLLQYLGKIILPFNLSVFPMINDTSYVFGFIALVVVAILIYMAKKRDIKMILGGFGWFFLLLIPVLLLPSSINNQDFEHRLYLPIIGILIILGESAIFHLLKPKQTVLTILSVVLVFAFINNRHQKNFTDPLTFWTAAVETTPNSSYAVMNMGSRIDEQDMSRSIELLNRAYQLNPDEKYINFYMGSIAMRDDSMNLAAKYLYRELELSSYYETYYLLSQIEFFRKNLDSSLKHLEVFLNYVPNHPDAIVNYSLMLLDTDQKEKAKAFVRSRQKLGIRVSPDLITRVMN